MSFTCPVCGRTSYNPTDEREGYCGNCHAFTGKPKYAPQHHDFDTEPLPVRLPEDDDWAMLGAHAMIQREEASVRKGDLVLTADGYYGIVISTEDRWVFLGNGLTMVLDHTQFAALKALPMTVDGIGSANFVEIVEGRISGRRRP